MQLQVTVEVNVHCTQGNKCIVAFPWLASQPVPGRDGQARLSLQLKQRFRQVALFLPLRLGPLLMPHWEGG